MVLMNIFNNLYICAFNKIKKCQSKVVSQWELLWDTGQLTRYFV